MSAANLAARMIAALETAAAESAGGPAPLVSSSLEVFAPVPDNATISVAITRKTRSLLFAAAEAIGPDRTRIATASSVHRLTAS